MNLCAWTLCIATTSYSVFGGYRYYQLNDPQSTALEFGLFDALTRIAWPIAVCYIIFACARNSGGPVNWFLSQPIWQPFARLSYAIYLIHFPMIQLAASSDLPPYFDEMKAFKFFIEVCALSFLVAIPATLAFVSPLDTIDQLIFNSQKKAKSPISKKFWMLHIENYNAVLPKFVRWLTWYKQTNINTIVQISTTLRFTIQKKMLFIKRRKYIRRKYFKRENNWRRLAI